MCGIAGILSRQAGHFRSIGPMNASLRHRGPDDEGYVLITSTGVVCLGGPDTPPEAARSAMPYRVAGRLDQAGEPSGPFLALAHRRLSILDLSPLGHQPMSFQGRYWITYNGEIYNYRELRRELEGEGYAFVSRTDTEVVLAAYARWGIDCLNRFNGMWAFGLYDNVKQVLFLARDRFGVKPLYYWRGEDGMWAFASEIKAFTGLPGWRPRLNGQAAHDFLIASLQDHSAETLFAGVFQVEPGHYMRLDCPEWFGRGVGMGQEKPAIQRWYQLRPSPFAGTFDEAAGRFRDLFANAVEVRLRSDVPVGSCLSGGLDSSSIVCVARRLLLERQSSQAQKTFSACSEIKRFDERDYVEQVVAVTGVEAHYVYPAWGGLFAELERLVWHQDEPFATTSIYAQWRVFGCAREASIKVMLDGQGADELLFGYPNFFRAFFCGLIRSGRAVQAWREVMARRGQWGGAASSYMRAVTDAAIPLSWQRSFRRSARRGGKKEWLGCPPLNAVFPGPLAERFRCHRSARELSLELLRGAHLQMLLHWEDRNSMGQGIEARVPFLDYRLVEFLLGLPDDFKIRQGTTKAVLRQGMSGLVPDGVLARRDKMGFVTPEEIWVRQTGTAQFRQVLGEAVEASRGVLTSKALTSLEDVIEGRQAYDSHIWRMISFGIWMRRFGVLL
jgi:asparagine synthase (glutamine-hydrolysing)